MSVSWMMQHPLTLLLRASYGLRAERFDPRQLLLFGLRVGPILQRIKLWLDAEGSSGTVLPQSPIGQAITYTRNQWPALLIYISNGNLSIDNNTRTRPAPSGHWQKKLALGRHR